MNLPPETLRSRNAKLDLARLPLSPGAVGVGLIYCRNGDFGFSYAKVAFPSDSA